MPKIITLKNTQNKRRTVIMATPHNQAQMGEIAKTVLMPGDPLRAKYIAETYLEDVKQFNEIRNMFGYTGTYKGKEVSVMGSGMGMPSVGIYSYELFTHYEVENIIRIGTAGSYCEEVKIYDVVLAEEAYSESSFAKTQNGYELDRTYPSEKLNKKIENKAKEMGINIVKGCVHSSDVYYQEGETYFHDLYKEKGCLCVEMESFALFHNAKVLGKNAACLLTISNSLLTGVETDPKERQTAFDEMLKIAIESAIE